MNRFVVDTNIVFSGILNTNSSIGDLLLNSEPFLKFYSVTYMRVEIDKYLDKIVEMSRMSINEVEYCKFQITKKIEFISEEHNPPPPLFVFSWPDWLHRLQYLPVEVVEPLGDFVFWPEHDVDEKALEQAPVSLVQERHGVRGVPAVVDHTDVFRDAGDSLLRLDDLGRVAAMEVQGGDDLVEQVVECDEPGGRHGAVLVFVPAKLFAEPFFVGQAEAGPVGGPQKHALPALSLEVLVKQP